jgi:hypothetical protein
LDAGNKEPPQAHLTGVQKAPRHEVAGSWVPAQQRARYENSMPAPFSMVSATRARGDVQLIQPTMTLSKARAFRFEQGSVRMLPGKSRKMLNWMMLALESNRVIGLRLAKLMRGGKGAQREAKRMVREKIQAAAKARASLMAGASSDEIVRQYRKRVAANAKRLGRQQRRRK